ncbi:FAD/NAD(P)-binding protein [Trujillonella endophytica]|uniref:Ferredoxin--NADP+ reductase n=1 Tax=Trujillonella endophytica TaxID=673521 RepID=A0A1H8V452_9ACTN|nr:FAD/NAD(P)-binding protein [Trujillella endophytica]SEP10205.1 ferredoxin--NADP+ reductase [Trujillella endophytica]
MSDAEDTATTPAARRLRVAIVGAGPAGIYAAEALMRQTDVPVAVDLIDRLPTPFGLVRHGIAPDHLKMRALRNTLHGVLDHEHVRFVGNVEIGTDLDLHELRDHVDAVIYTYGASRDRALSIEGEELPGSIAATDLVGWYCGHPDADRERIEKALAGARSAIVIGVGNVALDVGRVLVRTPEELEPTDMPQHVLDALAAAPVESVTVLGRRGPAQATFTAKELGELGELAGATVLVDPADLPGEDEPPPADRLRAKNIGILRGYADHTAEPGRPTLALRFYARPVRLLGEDRVTGIEVERTAVDAEGRAVGTGEITTLPADLVVRSVGYRGLPLPGLPLDTGTNTVPNEAGRVLREGVPSTGEYVAGWIKRGPTGVVGTNKHDARETVTTLLADVQAGTITPHGDPDDLVRTLRAKGVDPVLLANWKAIDAAETALGATRGRERTTMHEREALLAAARAAQAAEEAEEGARD